MRLTRFCGTTAATALLVLAGAATPALAAPSATGSDAAFLSAFHQANLAEIAAGRDALAHANSACVKRVADTFVREHTALDAQTTALAQREGVSLPTTPSASQQRQLALVQAKAGTPAYDSAWLNLAATAHEATLRLIDTEGSSGQDAQVREAAQNARTAIANHLQQVRGGTCQADSQSTQAP